MSAFAVRAHRKLPEFLVTTKEASVDTRGIESPIRARQVNLFEEGEELLDVAYGVGEVHIEVSTQDLHDLAEGPNVDFEKAVAEKRDAIRDDELAVAIIEYSGHGIVNIPGMEALVGILDEHFDVLVGLLMSQQLDSVDDLEANPEPYNRFVENTERFLGAVKKAATESAILGTIPVLSWDRMEELFDIQFTSGVDGFCVDFLDKKPTAQQRVTRCIAPLMERLGSEQCYRSSLLYAVNAYRGRNQTGTPRSPAEDFFAFGLGFDVLGGRYYFSRGGWGGDDEVQICWFRSDTYEQEYVPVATFRDELPERTGLDQDYIMEMVRDDDHRGRIQVLLETERMNVAYDELRDAIQDGRTSEFITEKSGTLDGIEDMMATVQDSYDEGRSSPSVTSY